ncbi:MAG TPA: multicopper oxidase domain-containing protein [Candidatus Binatia bacterium]|nr:multicopper oxidase domain-containing protein [Candidatus Binatia bacterium]
MTTSRSLWCLVVFSFLAAVAMAQSQTSDEILANQNRTPAGKLENGVLTVHLEIRSGTWHAEAADGPPLYVHAFAEAGKPLSIPGPLLRVPVGTTLKVTVDNKYKKPATVFGLNTRPGDPKAGIAIPPGESRETSFLAGAAGTYYYWARTVSPEKDDEPYLADAQLNGAFIVDPAGEVAPDRIFVLNVMATLSDALHPFFETATLNGKSYPYTEMLEYTEGETVRWRIINTSFSEHPMHMHGAFYKILSMGDFESDTGYSGEDRQSVVTQDLRDGHTMMMEWTPEHEGRWLFHCHFHAHISENERVPIYMRAEGPHPEMPVTHDSSGDHGGMRANDSGMHGMAMNDMFGLVLVTNVKPRRSEVRAEATPVRKIDLVVEPSAESGKTPTFSCAVREGKKLVASQDKAMGPPIVVTRGEPTEITVVNHLSIPTSIHWHGLELDSYYDGVVGGGTASRVTPAVAPGTTFAARFTPNRAGTFIYHTHAADADQLSGGIYGALIVLEPGEKYDPEHDRLLVVGARESGFFPKRLTLNGAEQPDPMLLKHGEKYRLRLINIAPDLAADFRLGSKEHPATWRALAKDGATVPLRLAKAGDATLHFDSGEVYDFEFQSDAAAEIPMELKNTFGEAKIVSKLVVQ